MRVDLRCENKLHGIMVEPHVLEVKCSSKFCGARPGVVRLHRFDVTTGELLGTKEYQSVEIPRRNR